MNRPASIAPRALLAAITLTSSTLAGAQAFEPFNFNVFANQRYDSNLFRLPDNVQPGVNGDRSVFSETAGAGVRFDKAYGLQRLIVDVSVTRYIYNGYGNLDYTGNQEALTYNWSITPELTGAVIIKHSNLPTDFAYAGFQTSPNPTKSDLRRLDVDFQTGCRPASTLLDLPVDRPGIAAAVPAAELPIDVV